MVWISVSLVLWTSKRTFILDKMHSRLFSVPFLPSPIEQVVIAYHDQTFTPCVSYRIP